MAATGADADKSSQAATYRCLTRQEVVDKLDTIPVFHIMTREKKICPVPDESGALAVRFYADPIEAESALVMVQALNPTSNLMIGVTPLGTAFALSEGWQPNGSSHPLQLYGSKAVLAAVAQESGGAALGEGASFALFGCEGLTSARVTPFWSNGASVKATWAEARPGIPCPSELQVTHLHEVVKRTMTDTTYNWRTLMLIATQKATEKAQQCAEAEAALESELRAKGLGDEPPPLE